MIIDYVAFGFTGERIIFKNHQMALENPDIGFASALSQNRNEIFQIAPRFRHRSLKAQ